MSKKQETQAGLYKPKAKRVDVDAVIKNEYHFTAAQGVLGGHYCPGGDTPLDRISICVVVTNNGTMVAGYSVCDPSQPIRPDVGKKQAKDAAVKVLFPQLLYSEREKSLQGGAA